VGGNLNVARPVGDLASGETRSRPGHSEIEQAGELRSARIESLRAIAALAVLFSHCFGVAHGFGVTTTDTYLHRVMFGGGFGVSLFFALTGYLLFWPFVRREFGDGGPIRLGIYARNRALRILPLYYVVLIVLMVVEVNGGTPSQWWRFLLFAENFSTSTVNTVDGPMWSLVVELHFYILLPALAWLVARLSQRSIANAAAIVIALGAASLAVNFAEVVHGFDLRWRYSLPATFFYFAAGMLVALIRLRWRESPPRWLRDRVLSSDLLILASLPLWAFAFYNYDYAALTAPASALVVAACVLPLRRGPVVRALAWRPLAALGVASYSLYLWHLPIVQSLGDHVTHSFVPLLTLAVPLCVGVAVLSYRAIEAPFLSLRRKWSADVSKHRDVGPVAVEPVRAEA
jgi:peptidoglycan/LPS O-acetylase OafA/YrhL